MGMFVRFMVRKAVRDTSRAVKKDWRKAQKPKPPRKNS